MFQLYELITVHPWYLGLALSILVISFHIGQAVYNVFFHPLRKYPGPMACAASPLIDSYYHLVGTTHLHIARLHNEYGDVVRIGPNELSYVSPQAWQDVFSLRTGDEKKGSPAFPKHPHLYFSLRPGAADLFRANDSDHKRIRRVLSWAFSERAVQAQEPIIDNHVHELISQLHLRSKDPSTAVVDLADWFDCITFEIVGNLLYGTSFGCLETGVPHKENVIIAQCLQLISRIRLIYRMPYWLQPVLWMFVSLTAPKSAINNHIKNSESMTRDRMARGILGSHDFMDEILTHNDKSTVTADELVVASRIIVSGATETSPAAMSSVIYHLLQNPACMERVTVELRSAFPSSASINAKAVAALPYLHAVLLEAMRIMPPAPSTQTRIVPAGPQVVCGQVVPSGTAVGVQQFAAYRSGRNFHEPDAFKPERWLGDARFANDRRQVMQPFGAGPRRCIGESVAWSEMQLILARLLWGFDLELQQVSQHWTDAKAYLFWHKERLFVKLTPVGGE